MEFGHRIDGIQKLCVELASVIHAKFHVDETIKRSERSTLYADFDDHFETLVNTKSIELAVNLRIFFEKCSAYSESGRVEVSTSALSFIEGNGRLSLRECANKIIHAISFKFKNNIYNVNISDQKKPHQGANDSIVEISGWHQEKLWRCELDLLKFAEESHIAVTDLQEAYIGLVF